MKKFSSGKWKDLGLVLAYMVFYLCFFEFVEKRSGVKIHMLQMRADYKIPFCEYFIIPYFLWFPYVAATAAFFTLWNDNRTEFYQFAVSMGIGMTLFLIISYIFPNGHNLRPYTFPRDNVFTDMVKALYQVDTPTNIMPSIHVFNSVMCMRAILECKSLKNRHGIRIGAFVLTILIVASTMFLKQHTILDVLAGLLLGRICWFFMYRFRVQRQRSLEYEEI